MRTLTVKSGGGGQFNFDAGWHEVEISKAKYGEYNGDKFLELQFADYPENFTLRIWAKIGKNGEEFAIGTIFRFANAGITEVMEDGSSNIVLKLDDSVEGLTGKKLNVFFYKKGEYTEAYNSVAPTVFKNAAEEFTEDDVNYWKGRAEKRFHEYTPPGVTVNNGSMETIGTDTTDSMDNTGIPF